MVGLDSFSNHNDMILCFSSKLRVNENIIMLFRSEDSQQCLLAQDWRGHILRINQGTGTSNFIQFFACNDQFSKDSNTSYTD